MITLLEILLTAAVSASSPLVPRMVELNVTEFRLDDVLQSIETQCRDAVRITLADRSQSTRKLTIQTNGKIPFWSAIDRVCDIAELDVWRFRDFRNCRFPARIKLTIRTLKASG